MESLLKDYHTALHLTEPYIIMSCQNSFYFMRFFKILPFALPHFYRHILFDVRNA